MNVQQDGILLRIFVGETDLYHGKPLYEQIVLKARELGIAAASVLRGIMGYGAASRIHTAKLLRLSEDLPVVIEIIGTEEKASTLLPFLDEAIKEGLVTMEKIRVLKYKSGRM